PSDLSEATSARAAPTEPAPARFSRCGRERAVHNPEAPSDVSRKNPWSKRIAVTRRRIPSRRLPVYILERVGPFLFESEDQRKGEHAVKQGRVVLGERLYTVFLGLVDEFPETQELFVRERP